MLKGEIIIRDNELGTGKTICCVNCEAGIIGFFKAIDASHNSGNYVPCEIRKCIRFEISKDTYKTFCTKPEFEKVMCSWGATIQHM